MFADDGPLWRVSVIQFTPVTRCNCCCVKRRTFLNEPKPVNWKQEPVWLVLAVKLQTHEHECTDCLFTPVSLCVTTLSVPEPSQSSSRFIPASRPAAGPPAGLPIRPAWMMLTFTALRFKGACCSFSLSTQSSSASPPACFIHFSHVSTGTRSDLHPHAHKHGVPRFLWAVPLNWFSWTSGLVSPQVIKASVHSE